MNTSHDNIETYGAKFSVALELRQHRQQLSTLGLFTITRLIKYFIGIRELMTMGLVLILLAFGYR
jgi:hypothetical protein